MRVRIRKPKKFIIGAACCNEGCPAGPFEVTLFIDGDSLDDLPEENYPTCPVCHGRVTVSTVRDAGYEVPPLPPTRNVKFSPLH